ncbi:MAG: cytochrome c oxidase subunit II [Gammaproteobacteria bacterium]
MSKTTTRWIGRIAAGAGLSLAVQASAWADWAVNMPRGVTEISNEVYELHMLIFGICVAIAVVVFGAMIWSIIYHRKARGVEAAKFSHSTKVEIVWTTIPIVILVAMAVPAADTLIRMEDTRDSDMTVKVTGYQWMWEYEYLDQDIQFFSRLAEESNRARQLRAGIDVRQVENYLLDVDNPMVVPVGAKVRLLLTANDVIHSWWVPDFGGKKDAIPGFINEFWFQAEEVGTFRGQCAELCGRDHAFMPIVVEVLPVAEFEAWLAQRSPTATVQPAVARTDTVETEAAPVAAPVAAAQQPETTAAAEWSRDTAMSRGRDLHQRNCAACHQADGQGLPAAGFPALAGTRIGLEEHIDVSLRGRRGTAMAAFGPQLDNEELAAIITYQRNAWGNDTGDLVEPADIAAAR